MGNWFKKIFGGKCNCEHGCCSEEEKQPTANAQEAEVPEAPVAPTPEAKSETMPEDNIEKAQ
jgi:hypothetical protein